MFKMFMTCMKHHVILLKMELVEIYFMKNYIFSYKRGRGLNREGGLNKFFTLKGGLVREGGGAK